MLRLVVISLVVKSRVFGTVTMVLEVGYTVSVKIELGVTGLPSVLLSDVLLEDRAEYVNDDVAPNDGTTGAAVISRTDVDKDTDVVVDTSAVLLGKCSNEEAGTDSLPLEGRTGS